MIRRIGRKVKSLFIQPTSIVTQFESLNSERYDIVCFDDFLPKMIGSWRSIEFASYLQSFPNSKLVCLLHFYPEDKALTNAEFSEDRMKFGKKYGVEGIEARVISVNDFRKINIHSRLFYCIFINNLKKIFPIILQHRVPFIFTLYPGGGFKLYDRECEEFLRIINASDLFQGVIVTHPGIKEYLTGRNLIDERKIEFIYSVPVHQADYEPNKDKIYYGDGKRTLDICFVAAKNTAHGEDKGFDVFSTVASRLWKEHPFVRFHVVGNFTKDDLTYEIPDDRVTFYGMQDFAWFEDFYKDKDILLSPVRAHVLSVGSFDGFPTGAAVDAALYGLLLIISDPLGDNFEVKLKDGVEVLIAQSNVHSYVNILKTVIDSPSSIKAIAKNGQMRFTEITNFENQIEKRIKLIASTLSELK